MRIQIRRRVTWNHLGLLLVAAAFGGVQTASADQCFNDDVIIDGSLGVGLDSVCNMSFGFDTIVLKENNLRIFFDDTSTSASFPRNDWRLTANDSSNGGGEYFSIDDATAGRQIFRVDAGAPANSLRVDSQGDVGINKSNPVVELHIVDGNTPTVRLDQDGSAGFSPQVWDLAGNETNFFIRDATNGSKLPFRIRPNSPTSSIDVFSDKIQIGTTQPVGFGTNSPTGVESFSRLTVVHDDDTASHTTMLQQGAGQVGMVLNRTGGTAQRWYIYIPSSSNELRWNSAGDKMRLDTSGNLFVTAVNPSSRELKRDIQQLDSSAAVSALEQLEPVEYFYKEDADNEHHVGFIAEDVPELVSTKSRKAVDSMEIIAVVTKVVKEQQATIHDQKKTISELNERLGKLEQQLQSQD